MYRGLRIGAIIAAAGQGSRMGSDTKKQFLLIGGKPLLAHTLDIFSSIEYIDDIVIVSSEEEIDYCRDNVIKKYDIKGAFNIVKGGNERQQSIMNGLSALKGICDIVVIHDGARPFVTSDIIMKSIFEACTYEAAACAVPIKDTVKVVSTDGFIVDTPDRSKLFAVQTPQTFLFDVIYNAHIQAQKEGFVGTDDTVLVERIGTKVKLFDGSYENIKITTPEDLYFAEAIINYRKFR